MLPSAGPRGVCDMNGARWFAANAQLALRVTADVVLIRVEVSARAVSGGDSEGDLGARVGHVLPVAHRDRSQAPPPTTEVNRPNLT